MTTTESLPRLADAADLAAIEAIPLAERNIPATTWEIVTEAAARFPAAAASTWVPDPSRFTEAVTVSFEELRSQAIRSANVFVGLGVGRTDAVTFLSPNVSTLLSAMLGAQAAGIAAPVNAAFDVHRIARLTGLTESRVLVAAGPELDADRWEATLQSAQRLGVRTILALRPDGVSASRPVLGSRRGVSVSYLEEAMAWVHDDDLACPPPAPTDLSAYFHTGGTTGAPKIAAHTHANEAVMAWSIATAGALGTDSSILAGLPLFHVNALLVTGLAPIVAGARSVWPSPLGWRDPALYAGFWRLVEHYGVTAMSAVPTVYATLADMPVDADISSLRTPIVGAAPLPPLVAAGFAARTGLELREGYGLTEAGCASSLTLPERARPGSVGQRLPYQRVAAARVVREAAGGGADESCADGALRLLPPGSPGELVIAGPTVFAGYLRKSAGVRSLDTTSIVDGWLRTGDLGSVAEDGTISIQGRSKDLIIRGGHNIDPRVIEDALLAHPAVTAAAAIGRPDRRSGEVPVAFVSLAERADVDGDALREWAAARIDEAAARPRSVTVLPRLPLTAVGKPSKVELRALVVAEVAHEELERAGRADVRVAVRQTDAGLVVELGGPPASIAAARTILGGYALALTEAG
ncbi:acyl-CoA synthetase [Leifsonia shinshuensis]